MKLNLGNIWNYRLIVFLLFLLLVIVTYSDISILEQISLITTSTGKDLESDNCTKLLPFFYHFVVWHDKTVHMRMGWLYLHCSSLAKHSNWMDWKIKFPRERIKRLGRPIERQPNSDRASWNNLRGISKQFHSEAYRMPQTRNFRPEIPTRNVGELKPIYYYNIFPDRKSVV